MKLPAHAMSWTLNGQPASEWMKASEQRFAGRAVAAVQDGASTEAALTAEMRWIVGYNISLFNRLLDDPDFELDEFSAADLVASAANRASEGHAIESVLSSYVAGTAAVFEVLADSVDRATSPDLDAIVAALFQYLRTVLVLVARGFQVEAARVTDGDRDARFAAYSALINGTDAVRLAGRAGVPISANYLVLAMQLGDHPPDAASGRSAGVPRFRRLNEVRRVLDSFAAGEVLALIRDPVGTALVPVHGGATVADARKLAQDLAEATGVPVHVGASFATVEQVPQAVEEAEAVLRLVTAIRLHPGGWTLDDVIIPYQLTRPGPARDVLMRRLTVLDAHPDWERTIREYIRTGGDRRATATALQIHPNTVDYRLRRFVEAAGLPATTQTLASVVQTALWVWDVARREDSSL